jgi:hypothetical protein
VKKLTEIEDIINGKEGKTLEFKRDSKPGNAAFWNNDGGF